MIKNKKNIKKNYLTLQNSNKNIIYSFFYKNK